MPNLEQTGLLRFGYLGLDEIAARADLWAGARGPRCATPPRSTRAAIGRCCWTRCAGSLAIDVECFTDDEFDRIQQRSQQLAARCRGAITEDDEPHGRAPCSRSPGRPGSSRAST